MDKYVLKKCRGGQGSYFFYKNGLLHREVGPAVLLEELEDKSPFLNLGDEHLYTVEILESGSPKDYKEARLFERTYLANLSYSVDSIIVLYHYLNGKPYTKKRFEEIKVKLDVKNELDKELPITETTNKKMKI